MARERKAVPESRESAPERVRNLFALDAANVMARVVRRREQMVELFGAKRDRTALLEPLRAWGPSAGFPDVVVLTRREQGAVSAFYEALEELRWYVTWTSDMPGTLDIILHSHVRALEEAYAKLCAVLPRVESDEPETVEEVVAAAVAKAEARASARAKKKPARRGR